MRLIKVIFAFGLLAIALATGLNAQPPATAVVPVPTPAGPAAEAISPAAPALFNVLGLPVTNSIAPKLITNANNYLNVKIPSLALMAARHSLK